MRTGWAVLGIGAALLLAGLPAVGAGNVAMAGQGDGSTFRANGSSRCDAHPLEFEVVYWPAFGKASAGFNYLGGPTCQLRTGGFTYLAVVHYDVNGEPVSVTSACSGTEATGLVCDDAGRVLTVGPYGGPESRVWIKFRGGSDYDFDGNLTAS